MNPKILKIMLEIVQDSPQVDIEKLIQLVTVAHECAEIKSEMEVPSIKQDQPKKKDGRGGKMKPYTDEEKAKFDMQIFHYDGYKNIPNEVIERLAESMGRTPRAINVQLRKAEKIRNDRVKKVNTRW